MREVEHVEFIGDTSMQILIVICHLYLVNYKASCAESDRRGSDQSQL